MDNLNKTYKVNFPGVIKNYKDKLEYRIKFEKSMNTITEILIHSNDNNISDVLKSIGEITNSNRVYIFEFKNNLEIMDNTYEWCSENTESQIDFLKNLSSSIFPWWMKKLKKKETIIINNVENIPEEGKNEKEMLIKQSIKSLVVIPLFKNELQGFIGFDDTEKTRNWQQENITLLKTAGNLILSYFDKAKLDRELIEKNKQLSKILDSVIKTLANIAENKDIYTKNHGYNVALISVKIAIKLGLDREQINIIRTGAQIHDIGKIHVPKSILFKPNRLTELEYEMLKKHTEFGYEIVKDIEFNDKIKKIILQHHERNNGSGYPQGLNKKEILFESKIVAVADFFEAITSERSYRSALSTSKTLDLLKKNSGILFDSRVVTAVSELVQNNELSFLKTGKQKYKNTDFDLR